MQSNKKVVAKEAGLAAILLIAVVFLLCNSSLGVMYKVEMNFFNQQSQYVEEIQTRFDIINQTSVLYLDAGVAPYYLMANSTGRYICVLPLQRDSPTWNMTNQKSFQQIYSDIMNYEGEYIVWDGDVGYNDWIHSEYENRKPIVDKISREYDLVWDKGWIIYRKR